MRYPVSVEVAGPFAMWADPTTGSTPTSYPVPTWSALRGILESIAWLKSAYIRPTSVVICAPIRYQPLTLNYSGPRRKSVNITKGNSEQFKGIALVDVCYQIHGIVEAIHDPEVDTNHLHHLQDMFTRRVRRGQSFRTPTLGWRNLAPSYVGPCREESKAEVIDLSIPSLLFSPWDRPSSGAFNPVFQRNVRVVGGVLEYPHPDEMLRRSA